MSEVNQASSIIDVALKTGISANPSLLDPVEAKLKRVIASTTADPQLHNAAVGAAVRVAGYKNFSHLALVGGEAITWWVNKPLVLTSDFNAIGKFTINCNRIPGATS